MLSIINEKRVRQRNPFYHHPGWTERLKQLRYTVGWASFPRVQKLAPCTVLMQEEESLAIAVLVHL